MSEYEVSIDDGRKFFLLTSFRTQQTILDMNKLNRSMRWGYSFRGILGAVCCGLIGMPAVLSAEEIMDLSGMWQFQLDMMGFGKTPGSELFKKELNDWIPLPGTTDQAGKGIENNARHVDRLTRKFEYMGQAWYRKSVVIPENWQGKEITLLLERCHWEVSVYVDGVFVGMDERLSTPNRFVLTKQLTPGEHTITLCVDNRLKYPMDFWNHGTTEYTQTNWNGIVGAIELVAEERLRVDRVKVTPNIREKKVGLSVSVTNPDEAKGTGTVKVDIVERASGKVAATQQFPVTLQKGQVQVNCDVALGDGMKLWDEFTPNLYIAKVELSVGQINSSREVVFGMREVAQGKHHVQLNGHNIHLRGVLDCCSFPLTGYPALDVPTWEKIFKTIKSYGMNHVRFHSWCPPKAAFEAADQVGMYLQAEMPMWIKDVGKYPARRDFFEKEMYAILDEYGNHPSFILMCNGNELEGNFGVLEDLIKKAQAYDNRRLYSASTARTHVKSDQFYTSHVTQKGGITVYEGWPDTTWDKRKESDIDVPVIAHESGQRCMFPNFKEMKKYTGVLEPRNFEVYRERLEANGMLGQADDFFKATGAHTVLQYKEVNEALLRTPNSGGFQLLGLSDFPGQGCAFVGVLDAFWEDKGLVTPEKFSESCAPTVLLCRIPKRVYVPSDTLAPKFEVYNFAPDPLPQGELTWTLESTDGRVVKNGTIAMSQAPSYTVQPVGAAEIPLQGVQAPAKYTLKLQYGDKLKNSWDIWVYDNNANDMTNEGYVLCQKWDESVRAALNAGKNVLYVPEKPIGRKTHFASHFWNPIMFNWEPMIVGTLIDSKSKAFSLFPTDRYADWQWVDVLNHSHAVDLTSLRQVTPIIQSIDTYERNRKLGIAFEVRVGKGKLFVLNSDMKTLNVNRTASRQLFHSISAYVGSPDFAPKAEVSITELDMIFGDSAIQPDRGNDSNNEAIKQLLNK